MAVPVAEAISVIFSLQAVSLLKPGKSHKSKRFRNLQSHFTHMYPLFAKGGQPPLFGTQIKQHNFYDIMHGGGVFQDILGLGLKAQVLGLKVYEDILGLEDAF